MREVYFHCSTDQHVLIDRSGTPMDLADARAHAERMVHTMIMTPSAEDWRDWAVHVTDDLGDELFVVPFSSLLGQLH